MAAADPRIDAFIAKAQPFARPILEHLRALVHAAAPEAEETIKWGMPHFTVSGRILAGMAAFKAHAAFFVHGAGRQGGEKGMGSFGKIAALSDLPSDAELQALLHQARDEIAAGAKKPKAARPAKPEIAMPDDFAAALAGNEAAHATYHGFAPSYRREYLEWITTAKTPATRTRRIAQTLAWLAEGKKRNWKYDSC